MRCVNNVFSVCAPGASNAKCAIGQITDAFEKAGVGLATANRLHHDGGQIGSVSLNYALELAGAVVVKWQRRSGQTPWHSGRLETREQVTVERTPASQIRRQIPIMPAMVTAERYLLTAGPGSRDSHRYRHRLAAAARVAHLLS